MLDVSEIRGRESAAGLKSRTAALGRFLRAAVCLARVAASAAAARRLFRELSRQQKKHMLEMAMKMAEAKTMATTMPAVPRLLSSCMQVNSPSVVALQV